MAGDVQTCSEVLWEEHPELDATPEAITAAIGEARTPLAHSNDAATLLTTPLPGRVRGYRAYDYLTAADDGQTGRPRPVPDRAWNDALHHADPDDAHAVGVAAYTRDNLRVSVLASEQAAQAGHPGAAFNLGNLLASRWEPPDLPAARRWYEQAAHAGHPGAAPGRPEGDATPCYARPIDGDTTQPATVLRSPTPDPGSSSALLPIWTGCRQTPAGTRPSCAVAGPPMTSIYGGGDAVKPNFGHTRAVATTDEYVARATMEIQRLLAEEHAVVKPELESRIAEGNFPSSGTNIDPHHITTALRQLGASGRIIWDRAPARGGRQDIVTIQPADQHRRTTNISIAAARKRLLLARYNGWADSTKRYPRGLIGPAGEAAVRAAVLSSGALQPIVPGAGEVTQLLGMSLPGAVDSAGFMVPLTDGLPGLPVTVLIEVKNIRSWVYPTSIELYQVLHKASVLQLAHPSQRMIPILTCRKAHPTIFRMAKQLGFVVIDTDRQPVGEVNDDDLLEVRTELHFQDLVRGAPASIRVHDRLRKSLPTRCIGIAEVWQATCSSPGFVTAFATLRSTKQQAARTALMTNLRDIARSVGKQGGW